MIFRGYSNDIRALSMSIFPPVFNLLFVLVWGNLRLGHEDMKT